MIENFSGEYFRDNNSVLILGDALETLEQMPVEFVDVIFADPPYFLSNGGVTCKSGKMTSVNKGDWDKISTLEEKHAFLLAVRAEEIFCRDVNYRFDKPNQSVEQYKYFMRATGLFDLLENHIVANLYDYVTGLEVGLDSNGRKNRGGHQMENLVEKFLISAGVTYHKEMYLVDVEKIFGIDLLAISAAGTSTKRFDFVVEAANKIFGIETNFYASGGSKLNETARSYKMIAEEAHGIKNFAFVWITDGKGWKSARKNLKETFLVLDTLYNIQDLENGILRELFNE